MQLDILYFFRTRNLYYPFILTTASFIWRDTIYINIYKKNISADALRAMRGVLCMNIISEIDKTSISDNIYTIRTGYYNTIQIINNNWINSKIVREFYFTMGPV